MGGQKHQIDTYLGCFLRTWLLIHNYHGCVGDFNEILVQYDMNGRGVREEWQMHNFRLVLDACMLRDVPFQDILSLTTIGEKVSGMYNVVLIV